MARTPRPTECRQKLQAKEKELGKRRRIVQCLKRNNPPRVCACRQKLQAKVKELEKKKKAFLEAERAKRDKAAKEEGKEAKVGGTASGSCCCCCVCSFCLCFCCGVGWGQRAKREKAFRKEGKMGKVGG